MGTICRVHRRGVGALVVAAALIVASSCTGATSWKAVDPPAKGGRLPRVHLRDIDCGGPSSCLALGLDNTEGTHVAAAAWDGRDWRAVPNSPVEITDAGVACAAPTWCLHTAGSDYAVWNGSAWVTGRFAAPVKIDDLSCPAVRLCFASSVVYVEGVPSLYQWTGGDRWTPVPGSEAYHWVRRVSCAAADSCTLFTQRDDTPASVVRWRGGQWATVPMTGPAVSFADIDCPDPSGCVLAGATLAAPAQPAVATVTDAGTAVTVLDAPAGAAGPLEAIGCAGPSFCVATGDTVGGVYDGRGWRATPAAPSAAGYVAAPVACPAAGDCFSLVDTNTDRAVLVRGDGSVWALQGPPRGADQPVPVAGLDDVSCPAPTWCLAVGHYQDGERERALAEVWDGTGWTVLPDIPLPEGRLANPFPRVDCWAPSACMAAVMVGQSSPREPVLARWDGTTWTVARPSDPPGAAAVVDDVSCAAPGWCIAVGTASGALFAETWDGTGWRAAAAPLPGDERVPRATGRRVNCPSPTFCAYVDRATFLNGPTDWVQFWDGTSWALAPAPAPASDLALHTAAEVDCTGPNACAAAGFATPGWDTRGMLWGRGFPAATTWNGRSWTRQALTAPAAAPMETNLYVSCAAAGRCLSVSGDLSRQGLMRSTWRSAWVSSAYGWSATTSPAQPAGWQSLAASVSCAGDVCMVVGDTRNGPTTRPMAYTYRLGG